MIEAAKFYDCPLKRLLYSRRKKQYDGLERVVRYNGEEKYLMKLIDTDLIKVYCIKQYRKEMEPVSANGNYSKYTR